MKTQKKSFRKKALLSSMSMLLVATVAVGSATFAWFTSNKTVTANGLAVKAAAAKGLQITGTNSTDDQYWGPSYAFTTTAATLSPISVDYSTSTTSGETTTTKIDKFLGTPYYPDSVGTTGAWVNSTASADIKDWQTGSYPITDINSGSATGDAVTSNGNFAAYQVGLRSTGEDIENVSVKVTLADKQGQKANASQYMRVAVLEQKATAGTAFAAATDNLIAVYGDESNANAISSITPAVGTDKQALTTSGISVPLTGVKITSTPKYYIVLVWFEGQDAQCVDTNQAAVGDITVSFSYTD